jgi:sugar/nucleoside kinase (ribokinase family)
VALDVPGLTRVLRGKQVRAAVRPAVARAFLAAADYVKASVEEMDLLCDSLRMSPEELLREFALREMVLTRGALGGAVFGRRGLLTCWSPTGAGGCRRARAVAGDPTGAGDVFFAAYLVERLWRRRSPALAAAAAARLAARQVRGRHLAARELEEPLARGAFLRGSPRGRAGSA